MMLPPFRVRNLHGRNHAVIQITAPQYDSTLKSHPNAALTYLDDDDGETITVGSGRELSERLDEPVVVPVASFSFTSVGDHDMHSFDINHASDSLAVWKDHEAYTSKSIKSDAGASSSAAETKAPHVPEEWRDPPVLIGSETWSSKASEPRDIGTFLHATLSPAKCPALPMNESSSASSHAETTTDPPPSTDTGSSTIEEIARSASSIVGELDAHINSLADFLQGTSNVLARAAEKTRATDPTTMESVITGFKGIFDEVLHLAKSALESCDVESTSSGGPVSEASTEPAKPELEARASQRDVWCAAPAVSDGIKPALPEYREAPEKKAIEQAKREEHTPVDDDASASTQRHSRHASCDDEDDATGKKRVSFKEPPPPAATAPAIHYRHGIWVPRETAHGTAGSVSRSILDLDSSDPDFSARYPPLLSLRRSRTTGTLRERSKSPARSTPNHQEALKRYPSVQQLEGRNTSRCLPNDERGRHAPVWLYTADADTRSTTPPGEPRLPPTKLDRDQIEWVSSANESEKSMKPSNVGPPVDPFQSLRDGVDRSRRLHPPRTESSHDDVPTRDRRDPSTTRKLPGAWPEGQGEMGSSALPTSHESSGAFFDRMTRPSMGFQPLMSQIPSKPLFPRLSEERLRAPHSDYYHCPPLPLNRAKSVSALNPASRLHRPFDPLIPTPQPASTSTSTYTPNGFPSLGFHVPVPGAPSVLTDAPLTRRCRDRKHQRPASPVRGAARPFVPDFIDDGYISATDLPRRSATERHAHRRRPYGDRFSGSGRLSWDTFEGPPPVRPSKRTPDLDQVSRTAEPDIDARRTHHYLDDSHDRTQRHGDIPIDPSATGTTRSKFEECVQQLRELGYGRNDPHEAARLKLYASAASSKLVDAIDMIEEDRRATLDFVPKGRGDMGSWRESRGWL